MERSSKQGKALIALVDQSERSSLFRWMVENHDDLVATAAGERIRWTPFANTANSAGLTDGNGAAPSPEVCRHTWYRARTLVAANQQRRQASASSREVRPPAREGCLPKLSRFPEQAPDNHPETVTASAFATAPVIQDATQQESATPRAEISITPRPATTLPVTSQVPGRVVARTTQREFTVEEQALIDQELSKAFGLLDHSDRFHKL